MRQSMLYEITARVAKGPARTVLLHRLAVQKPMALRVVKALLNNVFTEAVTVAREEKVVTFANDADAEKLRRQFWRATGAFDEDVMCYAFPVEAKRSRVYGMKENVRRAIAVTRSRRMYEKLHELAEELHFLPLKSSLDPMYWGVWADVKRDWSAVLPVAPSSALTVSQVATIDAVAAETHAELTDDWLVADEGDAWSWTRLDNEVAPSDEALSAALEP